MNINFYIPYKFFERISLSLCFRVELIIEPNRMDEYVFLLFVFASHTKFKNWINTLQAMF